MNVAAPELRDRISRRIVNHNESIVKIDCALSQLRGFIKGNYYHLDMTFDQMIFFRPLPELANYKTPIENLFLTGAGTHPGGSISGMPGRNCDRVFWQMPNDSHSRLHKQSNAFAGYKMRAIK